MDTRWDESEAMKLLVILSRMGYQIRVRQNLDFVHLSSSVILVCVDFQPVLCH